MAYLVLIGSYIFGIDDFEGSKIFLSFENANKYCKQLEKRYSDYKDVYVYIEEIELGD